VKLLIDAGNSRLKWGLWDGTRVTDVAYCPLKHDPGGAVRTLAAAVPERIEAIIVANVAGPWVADALRRGLARVCNTPPRFVATSAHAHGVSCAYAEPAKLGVDRWVVVIAAHHLAQGPAMVVDAGTAVTVDVVTDGGQHLGGLILAGAELMARALYRDTSDIGHARVQLLPGHAHEAFGRTTDEAVSFGAVWALVGAVERARTAARKTLSAKPVLYVTGGNAPQLLPYLAGQPEHRPTLLLEGLAIMAQG